jgi:hypothetical protein
MEEVKMNPSSYNGNRRKNFYDEWDDYEEDYVPYDEQDEWDETEEYDMWDDEEE